MQIADRAKKVAGDIVSLQGGKPDPAKTREITRIIETAMIDAYRDCTERNAKAALSVCEEDLDKAHKIAEEMRRANTALVANLSSLR